MRLKVFSTLLLFAWACGTLFAQDLAGTWQCTLKTPAGEMRVAIKVTRGADERLTGQILNIDQGTSGPPISLISVQDTTVKFAVDAIGSRFEGTFSKDGNSIVGTLVQASGIAGPTTLIRVAPEPGARSPSTK